MYQTKPLLNYPSRLLAAFLIGGLCILFSSCGNFFYTDDDNPCTDPQGWDNPVGNSHIELDTTHLDLFPYDASRKTLSYFLSNKDHHRVIVKFHLVKSEYLNVFNGVGTASPCDTVFAEVKRYYYEATSPKKISFTVLYDGNGFGYVDGYYSGDYEFNGAFIESGAYVSRSPEYWRDTFSIKTDTFFNVYERGNTSFNADQGFTTILSKSNDRPTDTLVYAE